MGKLGLGFGVCSWGNVGQNAISFAFSSAFLRLHGFAFLSALALGFAFFSAFDTWHASAEQ